MDGLMALMRRERRGRQDRRQTAVGSRRYETKYCSVLVSEKLQRFIGWAGVLTQKRNFCRMFVFPTGELTYRNVAAFSLF